MTPRVMLSASASSPLSRGSPAPIQVRSSANGLHTLVRKPLAITLSKKAFILEHALVIGRKAEAAPPEAVKTRLLAVQTSAATATSIPNTPLFAAMKSWFVKKHAAPVGE